MGFFVHLTCIFCGRSWHHIWDNGCGDVTINPVQDCAEGVIVVPLGDHWHHTGSPEKFSIVREPIKLIFKQGKIVDIERELEAKLIERNFEAYATGLIYRMAHIGWGTNEKALWLDDRLFCVAD